MRLQVEKEQVRLLVQVRMWVSVPARHWIVELVDHVQSSPEIELAAARLDQVQRRSVSCLARRRSPVETKPEHHDGVYSQDSDLNLPLPQPRRLESVDWQEQMNPLRSWLPRPSYLLPASAC